MRNSWLIRSVQRARQVQAHPTTPAHAQRGHAEAAHAQLAHAQPAPQRRSPARLLLLTGALALCAAASAGLAGAGPAAAKGAQAARASFSAHGSARQVWVTGLKPHARMTLINGDGQTVYSKRADALGGLLFRDVKPGSGYRVRLTSGGQQSGPITVHTDADKPWDPKVYDQKISDIGYQYLTTRDGTKLAIDVHPPTQPAGLGTPGITIPPGLLPDYAPPYPTLIEYSGYGYADPSGPQNGIAVLANLMGFAVVDVNMRGTGCSGGAYNYFEALQNLDGYDVIQTIAHQSWVLGHKVGMMGISYGAISQLFTAQTDPPALEAFGPLSTIDATATTLFPGGILNTGFAVAWAKQRQDDALPATANPKSGQGWAYQKIKAGDKTCKANQALHGEATNLLKKIHANAHYIPRMADSLDPISLVHKIKVPVFMACQWEDEQTGGHCPDLVSHFTGTKLKWFNFTNGAHIDSTDPYTYDHWYDFLELFVAHKAPILNSAIVHATAPIVYQQALGTPDTDPVTLPHDPIQHKVLYKNALAAFKKLPEVRVLFDNGAGASPVGIKTPGNPYPAFERSFRSFPVPGTRAHRWYLGPDGRLHGRPAASKGINWYRSNPKALPLHDFLGSKVETGGLWGDAAQWSWDWKQNPHGTAVSYISGPLTRNTTVIGAGAVHLWVRSSTPDVDLLATVSEVDPDGDETFVQNGYLRASERKLATGTDNIFKQRSTLLDPILSQRTADARPMPSNRFVEVVIPLYYEGHVYRKGTRIRVTIAAPNGTQPVWSFSQTQPKGTSKVAIEFSPSRRSSLILPVVPYVKVPTGIPPCGTLRNEPCRPYVRFTNLTSTH